MSLIAIKALETHGRLPSFTFQPASPYRSRRQTGSERPPRSQPSFTPQLEIAAASPPAANTSAALASTDEQAFQQSVAAAPGKSTDQSDTPYDEDAYENDGSGDRPWHQSRWVPRLVVAVVLAVIGLGYRTLKFGGGGGVPVDDDEEDEVVE